MSARHVIGVVLCGLVLGVMGRGGPPSPAEDTRASTQALFDCASVPNCQSDKGSGCAP